MVDEIFFKERSSLEVQNTSNVLDLADNFLTYLILGVIIGGRLGYVIFTTLYYLESY